jgi:hypothetical protein
MMEQSFWQILKRNLKITSLVIYLGLLPATGIAYLSVNVNMSFMILIPFFAAFFITVIQKLDI